MPCRGRSPNLLKLAAPVAMQVPVLTEDTAELLPNQCLVRFKGLVSHHLLWRAQLATNTP